jgi:molybdopterin-guanine dinucleotide biosynthesis protein A
MGQDKALLPWGDTDLLGHTIGILRTVTDDVRILSGAERRYADRGVPVEVDPAPDLGPLGGLTAALDAAAGDDVLLLGVDLPLVPSALLTRLIELAPGFDAVVPASGRGPEPLCALYGATCREPVRHRVQRGDLKMTSFWPDVRVREVGPSELRTFGEREELFLNVNAPEDYERARALGARR